MEKANNIKILPFVKDWSDIGSWDTLVEKKIS